MSQRATPVHMYRQLFPLLTDRVKVAMSTTVTSSVQSLELACGQELKYLMIVPVRYVNFMCFTDEDEQALRHMAMLLDRIYRWHGITGALIRCMKLPLAELPEYPTRRVLWLSYIATFAPEEIEELSIYPEGKLPALIQF